MNAMIFFIIVFMIPGIISIMFIPYWTRRTESFGVSIPESIYNRPDLKGMRKQYALISGMLGVVVLALFLLFAQTMGNDENTISILISIAVALLVIGSFLIYLIFHRKMKELKSSERWTKEKSQLVVIDTAFRDQKLNYSNWWFIISFIITLATTILTFSLYSQIPDKIPTQYGFSGQITNWTDKSYQTVLIMPITQIYLTLLFLFVNTMIAKAKQQVSVENTDKSILQNVTFRRRWSAFIIITGVALTLLFTLIQLSFIYPINQQVLMIVPLVLSAGVIIGSIILAITTGQGGSRVKTSMDKGGEVIDRDDDQYWKLGIIYFNKNDPAVFLEKRFGIGWTINCAHPLAWISLLVIIILAAGIPILLGA